MTRRPRLTRDFIVFLLLLASILPWVPATKFLDNLFPAVPDWLLYTLLFPPMTVHLWIFLRHGARADFGSPASPRSTGEALPPAGQEDAETDSVTPDPADHPGPALVAGAILLALAILGWAWFTNSEMQKWQ